MIGFPSVQKSYKQGRYAALDIGTVTCRMLIADVDLQGRLTECAREYAITNLGVGVDATATLDPVAMQRVVDVLTHYLQIRDSFVDAKHPLITTVALATSAARDADNSNEFTALLRNQGITLEVIPGKREAALSFMGASIDFVGERLLVVDIGGGSTEITLGQAGEDPLRFCSFNVGCRRVTEKFFLHDPPLASELSEARRWIDATLSAFFDELHTLRPSFDRIVAVAGTPTSVVSIHKQMHRYDSTQIHRAVVDRQVLDAVYDQLRCISLCERTQIVGLDPGRAPVIVAGLVILQSVLAFAERASFTVSETDILHGIIKNAALL